MPEQNVETVRRFIECGARGDFDALADLVDPSVEQHGAVGGLDEGRVLRGLSEIRHDYETVEQAWEEHRIEPQKLVDAGDRVVALLREYQRGRQSGVELVVDTAVVFDLRDERIVRFQGYMDQAAALEAVGLSPGDAAPGG